MSRCGGGPIGNLCGGSDCPDCHPDTWDVDQEEQRERDSAAMRPIAAADAASNPEIVFAVLGSLTRNAPRKAPAMKLVKAFTGLRLRDCRTVVNAIKDGSGP